MVSYSSVDPSTPTDESKRAIPSSSFGHLRSSHFCSPGSKRTELSMVTGSHSVQLIDLKVMSGTSLSSKCASSSNCSNQNIQLAVIPVFCFLVRLKSYNSKGRSQSFLFLSAEPFSRTTRIASPQRASLTKRLIG